MTSDNVKWLAGQETAGGDPIPPPDPVVVRLENQVADLRKLVEEATVLLKEACDSLDESVSKAADGRWYMKKMPSFINIGWQMRAIIWQAQAGGCDAK